ncbi:hypothetical protein RIF29_08950 [Crotalaria pallida]|uniref:TF-B3 domain-containing protein n=1 Tax=Crotalaria pallida TaxID=3830 RepID=A0AAN9FXR9_CROPI
MRGAGRGRGVRMGNGARGNRCRGHGGRGQRERGHDARGQAVPPGRRRGNRPYFVWQCTNVDEPPIIPFMPQWFREDHGGELPQGPAEELPPNQSGSRVRIRPTQWTITNNGQNLPPMFVNGCINNQLNAITFRGVDGNGNGNGLERTCGLYVSGSNYRITNGWRDFCQGMGIEPGFGLVLGVVDGARNIVIVQIDDHGDNENEDDEDDDNDDEENHEE